MDYDEKAEASSCRVHRTRTVRRAWDKHAWPEADVVSQEFEKITMTLDIVESATYTIHRNGVRIDSGPPSYWIISKDKPNKLIMARPREQQLVFHEDHEEESGDTDDENTSFNDEAVDNIEDALGGMSLGQARR